MDKVGYKPVYVPKVLDVACGKCAEAEVLMDFFVGSLLGVDNNEKLIRSLAENSTTQLMQFRLDDIRNLGQIVEEPVDIVIIRHPNNY